MIGKLRMKKAMELLQAGRSSVTGVGEQVGYRDISNFSQAFKKIYGKPPSFFMKRK